MPPTPLKKQKPDRQDRRSEPPESEEEWALVVQGFDMNSDGKIDHVDVIAEY